ncbi:MAG: class F sortase [Candidatus Saccharimonadaceae bacterium]
MRKLQKSIRPNAIILAAFIFFGAVLLVIGVLGVIDFFKSTTAGETVPLSNQTITTDDTRPSEKNPGPVSKSYTVPAKQPRAIQIPSLNVDAYVQRVGVTKDDAMATPNNIFFAGWYVKSVAPGDSGVSIINGHAGGRYEKGIFRNFSALKKGDSIRVQMGDLSWREFSVVSATTYLVNDSAGPLFHDDASIDNELHLITCDGVFDDKTQTYNERTIVVASLVV